MHSTDAGPARESSRSVSPKTVTRLCTCSATTTTAKSKDVRPPKPTPPSPAAAKGKPARWSCQQPAFTPAAVSTTSINNSYMQAVQALDPRPLEELHNERAYLLYDLQKQGDRATRLFERYAGIETRLAAAAEGTGTGTAGEAKKARKEAALVRARIAESIQQEQLLLLRLGEIHVELQNRERWMQVHQNSCQQRHQQQYYQPQPLPETLQGFLYPSPPPPPPPPPHLLVYPLPSIAPPPPPPPTRLGTTLLSVSDLSPCLEKELEHEDHDAHEPSATTTTNTNTATTHTSNTAATLASAATELSTSDYFSCASRSGSVLSPLSPCFTPGVVFAEDIWSRPANKTSASSSSAERQDTMSRSTPGDVVDGVGVGNGDGRGGGCGSGGGVGCGGGGEDEVEQNVGCGSSSGSSSDTTEPGLTQSSSSSSGVEMEREGRAGSEHQRPAGDNGTDTRRRQQSPEGEESDEDAASDDSQAWRDRLRRVSLYLPRSARARDKDKRMSLPYLKSMWSRSRRGSLQSMGS